MLPGLSPICGRAVVARFDSPLMSSDGGLPALREVELRLGIAARLAGCISDSVCLSRPAVISVKASMMQGLIRCF